MEYLTGVKAISNLVIANCWLNPMLRIGNCDKAVKYPALVFRNLKLGNSWRMVDALTRASDEGRSDLR
jgi:hypothetical protein